MKSSRTIVAIAACIVLAAAASACSKDPNGADDASSADASDEAAGSTPSLQEAGPAATLADVCTSISPAMQRIPGAGPYKEIVALLAPVVAAADDTAAVFQGLYESASEAVETIGTTDYLDVEAEFDSLIPGVVSTCKAAGAPL